MDTDVEIQEVLANFREIIGMQAQEIATLRAIVATLKQQLQQKETAPEKAE